MPLTSRAVVFKTPLCQMFLVVFLAFLCSAQSLRSNEQATYDSAQETEDFNPNGVGRAATKTVQLGLKNAKPGKALNGFRSVVKPGNGLNGFQFGVKGNALNGFHAKPPTYAFNGFRSQMGHGIGGFGHGVGGFGTRQFGMMPAMPGNAQRFAHVNAQVAHKLGHVQLLGFQNLPKGNFAAQITEAVGRAAQLATEQEIATAIRRSSWNIWKRSMINDVHVLVSQSEMAVGKAAKDFLARFKIQKEGKDLFVTILKRTEFAPPKRAINFGPTEALDRTFRHGGFPGLRRMQNIFSRQSLKFIAEQVYSVMTDLLSDAQIAKGLETALLEKWGNGFHVVVSKAEQRIAMDAGDIMAHFKARSCYSIIDLIGILEV